MADLSLVPKTVEELMHSFVELSTNEYRQALAFFALNATDEELDLLQHGFWEPSHGE
jgi:hypothetical protein